MSSRPELRLDFCSYRAAKTAVMNWHYSGSLSSSLNVFIGVWESGKFIGCIVFGLGSGNVTNGKRYGLARSHEMAELTRVALDGHKNSVTRIISIAIRLLKVHSPGLRCLISFADQAQGHTGGIYQGGNWIFTGESDPDYEYKCPDGRWAHHRTAGGFRSLAGIEKRRLLPKYRYLMPLDDEMRTRILPLSKPYPKRAGSDTMDTLSHQDKEGGSTPTPALQSVSLQ